MTSVSGIQSKFVDFIRGLLKSAGLTEEYIGILTSQESMIEFQRAFTTKKFNPQFNYEFYEILGDATSNKIVVWYFMRRFPEIFNKPQRGGAMGPVAVMARLKMEGISKKTYSEFAEQLGFYEHIICTPEDRLERKSILEDTFEAFVGCLESLVDTKVGICTGYSVIYEFMRHLMDKRHIDLENLYDNKSLLNTEYHKIKNKYKLEYKFYDRYLNNPQFSLDPRNIPFRFEGTLSIVDKSTNVPVYTTPKVTSSEKPQAEQKAAGVLLKSGVLQKLKS
jgi:dsRNA-specific ribonuclease